MLFCCLHERDYAKESDVFRANEKNLKTCRFDVSTGYETNSSLFSKVIHTKVLGMIFKKLIPNIYDIFFFQGALVESRKRKGK